MKSLLTLIDFETTYDESAHTLILVPLSVAGTQELSCVLFVGWMVTQVYNSMA